MERFLVQIGGPSQPPTGPDEGSTDVRIVVEDYAKLPDAVPPPRVWLDSHGDTPDCAGCASRKGRHTNKCVARYRAWMLDQARQRSDGDVAVGDGGLPDLFIEEYTPSYEPEEAAGAGQKGPDKPKEVEVQEKAPALKVEVPRLPPGMPRTAGCPSCDFGMNAPGIRHSKKCQQRQAEFRDAQDGKPSGSTLSKAVEPPLSLPDPEIPADVPMGVEPPETAADEAPMDVKDIEPNADVAMEMVDSFGAQFRFGKLQDGDLVSLERLDVNSIAFDGSSSHDSKLVDLCATQVRLWKPTSAVSDTSIEDLDPSGMFAAMQKN